MKNSSDRFWLWPVLIIFFGMFAWMIVDHRWAWNFYDDWSWVNYHRQFGDFWKWTVHDFKTDGRLRPLSAFFPFIEFDLFGEKPYPLIALRLIKVFILSGLTTWWLVRRMNVGIPAAMVGLAFWLKSPTLQEQLRHVGISEITALGFFAAGLCVHRRSRPLSYVLLALAALTKEPFAFLIPLPALLESKRREVLISGFVTFAYLGVLFLMRKSMTVTSPPYSFGSMTAHTVSTILKNALKDTFLITPLFFIGARSGSKFLKGFILFSAGLAYCVLVAPRAWDYNYIFLPASVLIGLSVSFLIDGNLRESSKDEKRLWVIYIAALLALFVAKAGWSYIHGMNLGHDRYEAYHVIAAYPSDGAVSSNCLVDVRGVGFLAAGRSEGLSCAAADVSVAKCCASAALLALAQDCVDFQGKTVEADRLGLKLLYSNPHWRLYECPKI